jgi:hypothetical protein
MTINLTEEAIDTAISRLGPYVETYLWLQAQRDACDVRSEASYRKRFNAYYKVRRGRDWQDKFFELLERRKGRTSSFAEILDALHRATGRYEASFASKLLATIDPQMPVIDSIVLRNLDVRLPAYGSDHRRSRIIELHGRLRASLNGFLATDVGRYLVKRFRAVYPDADVAEIKMLDLVLWQTRPKKTLPAR